MANKTLIATLTGETFVAASAGAITFVGSQGAGFAGKTSTTTVAFALTGGIASTPAAGDLVIIAYHVGSTSDVTLSITDTTPTAYTLLGSELYQDDTYDSNLRVCYKVMGGTPDTQFILSGTGSTSNAGRYTVHVFRGVHADVLEQAVLTGGGTNGHAVIPPAILPTTSGTVVYCAGGSAATTGAAHTSADLTGFISGRTNDDVDSTVGAGYFAWTSGTFTPATWVGRFGDNRRFLDLFNCGFETRHNHSF